MSTTSALGQVVTYRQITTMRTELGEERLCPNCREFWPNDSEFFPMRNGRTRTPCKACFRELPTEARKRVKRREQRQLERQQ